MKNKIVRKSNDLVEAQYSLSIWEMRVFIKMMSMINKDDTDFKQYRVELGDFIKEFGLEKNKQAYSLLKEGARGLLKKIVIISKQLEDGTVEHLETPMVVGVAHNIDKNSYIKLSFHPEMKPYMLELQSRFMTYDISNVMKLPSPYSIRLYELAKQYVRIGRRVMTLDELKRILDIGDKYAKYAHFKQKVLLKSTTDISKYTDIDLSFNEIKEGRRVAKLEFIIKAKSKQQKAKAERDELGERLHSLGVTDTVAKKWRKKYEDAHVQTCIEYLEQQDTPERPIGNKAAYLNSILDQEIKIAPKLDKASITKRVNAILFSNPNVESRIRAKYGNLSQQAIEGIVQKMFPEKFQ